MRQPARFVPRVSFLEDRLTPNADVTVVPPEPPFVPGDSPVFSFDGDTPVVSHVQPITFESPDRLLNPLGGTPVGGGWIRADVNGDGKQDAIQFTPTSGGQLVVQYATDPPPMPPLAPSAPPLPIETDFIAPDGPTSGVVTPFEASYRGGLNVAAGDLDGDGKAEIVVAPKAGGSGRIEVLRYDGGGLVSVGSFFAIEDPNYRGGATVAVGDFNGDGKADIAVGAGEGGPRVAVYAGGSDWTDPTKLRGDFFGLDDTAFGGGVSLAAGDFDEDGVAELAVGAGRGGAPRVVVLSGARVSGDDAVGPIADFFAVSGVTNRAGVSLQALVQGDRTAPDLIARVSGSLPPEISGGARSADLVYRAAQIVERLPGADPVGAVGMAISGYSFNKGVFHQYAAPIEDPVVSTDGTTRVVLG